MKKNDLTRRSFLVGTAAASALAVTGCPPRQPPQETGPVKIYRRSGRGRRVSNASKKHSANRRYADPIIAALDRPHPGDRSKVVEIIVSRAEFNRLFPNFPNGRVLVDLRWL